MKRIRAILAAAVLLSSISVAHAEDFYWDFTLGGERTEFLGESVPGSFVHKIHFMVEQVSNIDFGVGPLSLTLRGIPLYDIQGLSMSLFDGEGNSLGNGVDFSVGHLIPNDDYYLQIAGNATGTAGGMYYSAINVTSLPVPEPGMGSTLAAGLLMLSFMALRRRNM